VRRKPSFADAWNNLANVLAMQGKSREAEQAYEQSLTLDPKYVTAYLNYAKFLLGMGETAKAQAVLRQLQQIDPANSEALRLLGNNT